MKIIYSAHAKKRMKERGIEDWEIEHTLRFPSYVRKGFDERREAVAEIRNRKIKVVFIKLDNYIKVVTVL